MLTQEQRAFYDQNGYILVPGLLRRDEARALREEAHALIDRLSPHANLEATWGSARQLAGEATQTSLLHRHNVEFYSAAFTRLILDERMTSVAADIIGSPNVQLHHTKLFIKPPEKGSPFPMHQDYPFFPHARHSMMAAVFHFDDAPLEKGCLLMVPGSNKLGPLKHDSEGAWHLPFEEYRLESAVPCLAKAGDVLFFSYLTIHGSGINVSQEARTTLLVQMRDPVDSPIGDGHPEGTREPGQGLMLRGIAPAVVPVA